jgi:hypothetical protein
MFVARNYDLLLRVLAHNNLDLQTNSTGHVFEIQLGRQQGIIESA